MKTLYLDMDGVLADFDTYARQVLGHPTNGNTRWSDEEWKKLGENPRLYRDLDKTAEADDLVAFCRNWTDRRGWDLKVLTAVPKGNDMPWAFYDKVVWMQRRYPNIPVMFGPYSQDKQHHAQPGDILIDDRTSNCEEWRRAGGVAIQHRGDLSNTLDLLRMVA